MRQSTGIDDDGIDVFKPGLMDSVNQGAFMIALETGETGTSLFNKRAYHGNDIIKGFFAIDVRFPHTQQVQVRAVEQKNIFSHGVRKSIFLSDKQHFAVKVSQDARKNANFYVFSAHSVRVVTIDDVD